ncbi:hypothetical protein C6A37_02395 [Desulfobacteraceae bacterium SEEP-SAG9]|nr:hypothetical protein C6A37_02395 [Desulfobacteraceae bacterium SEEP-SAG9]
MKTRLVINMLFALLFFISGVSAQTTYIVAPSGGDFTTIQDCINGAINGDICLISPGVYVENIDFIGKNLTVKSSSGPEATSIDGADSGSVVRFQTNETAEAILDGFMIRNGNDLQGGGIFCQGSSPTIKNCIITENEVYGIEGSDGEGAGIYCNNSSPRIMDCTISYNIAAVSDYGYAYAHGGGIYSVQSSSTFTDCTITHNEAGTFGGGISCWDSSSSTFTDCIISNNSALGRGGGGIYSSSTLMIERCTVSDNYAYQGGGIYSYGETTISDSIIAGNSSDDDGGGIFSYGNILSLVNCTIFNNSGNVGGGVCFKGDCNATIANSIIADNTGNCGGGIAVWGSPSGPGSFSITESTISGNTASGCGGGFWFDYVPLATVTNCMIFRNTALGGGGGGGNITGETSTMINSSTFFGNSSTEVGGGIFYRTDGDNVSSFNVIKNCILWDDSATDGPEIALVEEYGDPELSVEMSYSDVKGGQSDVHIIGGVLNWQAGNIESNPLFVDPDGDDNLPGTLDDDFHLTSDSLCIDAGTSQDAPSIDIDGDPRPQGAAIDIGADEYIDPDSDGDGIEYGIDIDPTVFSSEFSDAETTYGIIIDRGDQVVTVIDLPDPNGVRIAASGGDTPASVSACGGSAIFTLNDGDVITFTCGSVKIEVISGPVKISFVADDGTTATTTLDAGNILTFEPETLIITAPDTNTENAVIVVDGKEFAIEPGESVELDITIVIDGCDTGVLDSDYEDQSISEWISQCAENAKNHGKYVSCVAKLTKKLKKAGVITGKEKGAIQSCAAQADIH